MDGITGVLTDTRQGLVEASAAMTGRYQAIYRRLAAPRLWQANAR